MKLLRTLVVGVGIGAAAASAVAVTQDVRVTSSSPTAAKLASIQEKSPIVPASLVRQFDTVLTALEKKCTQNRDPRGETPGISDFAVTGVNLLEDKGKRVTHLAFLQAMDQAIPESDVELNCAEIAAAIVTLIDQGGP